MEWRHCRRRIIVSRLNRTVLALYHCFYNCFDVPYLSGILTPLFPLSYGKVFKQKKTRTGLQGGAGRAAIGMPRVIIIFQVAVWFIGTTAYYAMNGWTAESGIPFIFGLLLKISSGLIRSALYVVFFINLLLIPDQNGPEDYRYP